MTWRATHLATGIRCPVTHDEVMARVATEDDAVWVDDRTAVAGAWMFEELCDV